VANALGLTYFTIANPIVNIWDSFVYSLPGLLIAIIALVVGYFVSIIFGYVTEKIFKNVKLDDKIRKWGLGNALGGVTVSTILTAVVKWYVFILFLQGAVSALSDQWVLSSLLVKLANWLPNVVVAFLVVIVGLIAIHYVGNRMLKAKLWGIKLLTAIVRGVIFFMVAVIALTQAGLNVSILENTFLLIIGGVAVGIALALGIGLGLGLKKEAEDLLKDLMKK